MHAVLLLGLTAIQFFSLMVSGFKLKTLGSAFVSADYREEVTKEIL